MKCAICNRTLLKPAFTAGRMNVGRVCAEKAGLIVRKKREAALFSPNVVQRDPYTRDWVNEVIS